MLLRLIVGLVMLALASPAQATWPNKPAGHGTVLECNFSTVTCGGVFTDEFGGGFTITDTSTSGVPTESPTSVFVQELQVGHQSGGTLLWKEFPAANDVYFGFWIKRDYDTLPTGFNKIGYLRGSQVILPYWYWYYGGQFRLDLQEVTVNNCHIASIPHSPDPYCPIFTSTGTIPINTWTRVEMRLRASSSPTSQNGIIQAWIDGAQVMNYTNVNLPGIFHEFQFTPTWTSQTAHTTNYHQYIDHVIVTTASSGDTTPPTPPSTPTLTPIGGGQISLAWTNGTDANGVTSTTILRCTGAACSPVTTLTTINDGATVTYTDTSVAEGTTYGYRLFNSDAAGNASAQSAIAYATTGSSFKTTTLTDAFNRADSTELGAAWDAGYTSFYGANTNLAIVSNQLRVATLAADSLETNNTAIANDQWAQITFSSLVAADANVKAPGLMLRANAPGNLTGYACRVFHHTGTPHTRIERWDGLVSWNLLASEDTTLWLTGDKLRCEAEGTTIRLYQIRGTTETLVLSTTDATYASGRVGLIHFVAAGTAADIQIDDFTAGEFAGSVPPPPAVTSCTGGSRVSTTCVFTGIPAMLRIATEFGSVVEPLSSFPSGVYIFPANVLTTMTDFFCVFARDILGVENTDPAGYQCNSVPFTYDSAAAVLSNPLPTASLPNGTTSTQITATIDKTANVSCRYDTTDMAYTAMQTTVPVFFAGFSASATVTGLVTGDNLFYMGCVFTDIVGDEHTSTNLLFTVNVAASTADTTVPSTVTNLAASPLGSSQAELAWTVATDNIAVEGYNVYLSVGAGNTDYVLEQIVGTTATRAVVNLGSSATYNFVVKARDTSQNLSAAYSNVATVTTEVIPDVTPPSTVTNARVIGVYKNSIWLGWDQSVDDRGVPTVTIEYCEGATCSDFTVLVSRYALDHLVVTLAPSTSYSFRILAVDNASNAAAAYSNVVTAVTAATGLERPRRSLSAARLPRN